MTSWLADADRPPIWMLTAMGLTLAAAVGAALPYSLIAFAAAAAASGVVLLSALGRRSEHLFLGILVVLLLGYLMQGRGFAYFGIPPLYVGELVLAIGVAVIPFARITRRLSTLELLLIAFMVLGFLRTLPYVSSDGLDAIRDAATWYYAAYALLVARLLTEERLTRAVQLFAKAVPILLLWILAMSTVLRVIEDTLPHYPGSPLPIVSVMKPGDRAVVLAGIAAFLLTGLYHHAGAGRRVPTMFLWGIWLLCALLVAVETRGGFLALALALLFAMAMLRSREWTGEGLKIGLIGIASLVLLLAIDPAIDIGTHRTLSANQLFSNIVSIFSDRTADVGSLQGTRGWRLQFWTDIYDTTVRGSRFLGGHGFGANLASEYGYQIDAEEAVRAPHSIHFTILGRMGVPGALLWIALQVGFLVQMLRAIRRERNRGSVYWAGILIWLLAIWTAALVTGSFDPYLEGPQGAIPFWCAFGAGIAVSSLRRQAGIVDQQVWGPREGKFDAHPLRP